MKASVHLVVSLILAAALYPFFKWVVVFVIAGGFLIDVDHYLWYVYKYRKTSLAGCYRHYMRHMGDQSQKSEFETLLVFHTIEFLLLAIVLSFYFNYVFAFTTGLLAHYLLDLIYLYSVPKKFIVNHSAIHWLLMQNSKTLNN